MGATGFGAGLADALEKEQELDQTRALEEARIANETKATDAQVQASQDADTRANQLQPGAIQEQGADIEAKQTATAGAKQQQQQNAQVFPDEVKIEHYKALQSQLDLNDKQMLNLHNSGLAATRLMDAQFQEGGNIDTKQVEQAFNENAPAGFRMKPGTLTITKGATPGDTQVSYVGDDGKPHVSTLQHWNDMAVSVMPPVPGVALNSDQRLVSPVSGATITPALTTTPTGKTDPTAWTSQASRQMATAFGGLLDVNGNVTNLTNDQSATVSRLAGIASAIGKNNGYGVPAPTVVGAVKQAYDEMVKQGKTDADPSFLPRVQQIIQSDGSSYGANPGASPAPAGSGAQGASGATPQAAPLDPAQRTVGTVYNTPKGPMKWMGSGWLPPNS